jgi:hypothetical protein
MAKKDSIGSRNQHTAFKELARELECDESSAAFDGAIARIGKAKAAAATPRKRKLIPRPKK